MITRFRELLGTPAASVTGEPQAGSTPNAGEAIAAWALGTAWAICCLWLWRLGPGELVPVALIGALLTLWGWRSVTWLHWFPPVAIAASLLDLVAPMPARSAPAGFGYVGMIAFTALLLGFARLLALGRAPIAGRPREVAATLLGALGLGLALAGASPRACATGIVAFAAALVMAAHPTGERRVWVAFPLTALLIGLHAAWTAARGPAALLAQIQIADFEWGVPYALLQLLLFTLPVTIGLALDAGPSLRLLSRVAAVAGTVGLVLHAIAGRGLLPATSFAAFSSTPGARGIAVATTVIIAIAVGRLGVTGGFARPRWIGLASSLIVAAVLLVWGRLILVGTAQVLLAFGVALGSAVPTAERRARRLGLSPAQFPLAPHTTPAQGTAARGAAGPMPDDPEREARGRAA